jgi:hypothetical protein
MNKLATQLSAVALLIAGSGLAANTANAAAVSATAQLFDVTQSGGATLAFSNNYFTQDVQTTLAGDTFNTGTVAQDYFVNNSSGGNFNVAESSRNLNGAPNLPYTNAGVTGKGQASSMFQWSFDYSATGAGLVTVDFDYNYNATILNLNPGETAGVSSSVDALVDGLPASEVQAFHYFVNQNNDSAGEGHLLLTFNVADGQKGTITFTAASQGYANPVPAPAAIWLLGSALTGIGAFGRRRKS